MNRRESLLLFVISYLMLATGVPPVVVAAAAPPPAPADTCPNLDVTVTADLKTISSNTSQQALQTDLADAIAKATTLTPSQSDSLVGIGWRLARAATNWNVSTQGKLGEYLTDAMKAACETLILTKNNTADDAYKAALAAARFPGISRSQFHLYAGSVNSLQAQGGFTSNVEADFLSRTTFIGSHEPTWAGRELDTLDGVFELTYAKIGAVASSSSSSPTPAQNATANPFTSSSGILRVNGSVDWTFCCDQYLGVSGGVGATSRTSSSQSSANLSPRGFLGILFLANYGNVGNLDATTGRILVGYAYDDFWKTGTSTDSSSIPSQPNRVFLDGRIDFPGVFKSQNVKFSFQIYADAPAASHGPADVRFSLLVSVDLQSLFGSTS